MKSRLPPFAIAFAALGLVAATPEKPFEAGVHDAVVAYKQVRPKSAPPARLRDFPCADTVCARLGTWGCDQSYELNQVVAACWG